MNKCDAHKEECKYKDEDRLLYCLWEIGRGERILISALEYSLVEDYMVRDFFIYDQERQERVKQIPYKIVYGIAMFQQSTEKEEVKKRIAETVDYAYIDLDEDIVHISVFQDIEFKHNQESGELPFAALMRTEHEFPVGLPYSITMFLRYKNMDILDNLANRPFLLACRYAEEPADLTMENWKTFIDYETMDEIAKIADLYTGE